MYKMIVSDLDGTLLNNNKGISHKNIEFIKRAVEKGIYFVIATGRIYKSAFLYSKLLEVGVDIASCNGAYTVDKNNKVILSETIGNEELIKIEEIANKYNQFYYFYDKEDIYTKYDDSKERDFSKYFPKSKDPIKLKHYKDIRELIDNNIPIYKSLYVSMEDDILENIEYEFEDIGDILVTSSSSNNVEVNKMGVSKGRAVELLAKKYNIKPEEIITIGDNRNDISMLTYAGLGVAVGNSGKDIKDISDYVTVSNEEDAIAQIIEEFIF